MDDKQRVLAKLKPHSRPCELLYTQYIGAARRFATRTNCSSTIPSGHRSRSSEKCSSTRYGISHLVYCSSAQVQVPFGCAMIGTRISAPISDSCRRAVPPHFICCLSTQHGRTRSSRSCGGRIDADRKTANTSASRADGGQTTYG